MSRCVFIGTSGWTYPHWKDIFYPGNLAQKRWLEYYVNFFSTVELNVTFYRLVKKEVFENWYKRTPKDFHFVAKGSRFITHIKKLKDVKEPLKLFMDNTSGLKAKLAAILWQFPSNFNKDLSRLEEFLRLLKRSKIRQVFEFRNVSWFDKEAYRLLKSYNACLCIAHSSRFPCVKEIIGDFIYLRFHGGGSLYSSNYKDKELGQWVKFAKADKRKDIFVFFNNDAKAYAIKNALRFRELLK